MSVQAMGRVMECSRATGVTRMVLLLIANHETEDRGAWPSIERLAREAGAGIRTVQDAIARAKKLGELEVGYRQGPHGTNVYRVLVGLSTTATLPGTEPTRIRTPQNPHPADERQESAPELKELGVKGSSTASASSLRISSSAERLCTVLADLVEENGSKRPSVTGTWLIAAERMLRIDGRDADHAERLIRWSQADPFWRGNVMSMPTFRAKFDQLRLKSNGDSRSGDVGSDAWIARQMATR